MKVILRIGFGLLCVVVGVLGGIISQVGICGPSSDAWIILVGGGAVTMLGILLLFPYLKNLIDTPDSQAN